MPNLVALCLPLGSVLLFGGLREACIAVLIGLPTLGLQVYFRQRLGGITGDMLGATDELNAA